MCPVTDPRWKGVGAEPGGCWGGLVLQKGDASVRPDMAVVIGVVDPGWVTIGVGLVMVAKPPRWAPLGVPVRVLTGVCGVGGLDTVVGRVSSSGAGAFWMSAGVARVNFMGIPMPWSFHIPASGVTTLHLAALRNLVCTSTTRILAP